MKYWLAGVVMLAAGQAQAFREPQFLAPPQDIFKTQEVQEERITNAVRSGQMTEMDAKRLKRDQDKIDAAMEEAEADGKMSTVERRRIQRMQKRSADSINRRLRARDYNYQDQY